MSIIEKSNKMTDDGITEKNEGLIRQIIVSVVLIILVISIYTIYQVQDIKNNLATELDETKNMVSELQGDVENLQLAMNSDNPIYMLRNCDGFSEYLGMLRDNTGYTAIIAVRDIQGYCLHENETDILKSMGFDHADTLLETEYHSFIGVIQDGKMIYQQVGGDELISYDTSVGNMDVHIESATLNTGNKAIIALDGIDRSVNERGYNIVVIENESGRIADSVEFDAFFEEKPCKR